MREHSYVSSVSWLTSATGPWWTAPAASVVSFVAGQWIATRAARDQREGDAAERQREREAAAEAADKQRASDLRAAHERREAEARAAAEARTDALFVQALDAIHALQGELSSYRLTGRIDPSTLRDFSTAVNRIRVFEFRQTGSYFDSPDIVASVSRLMLKPEPQGGEEFDYSEALRLVDELTAISTSVAEMHRAQLERSEQGG